DVAAVIAERCRVPIELVRMDDQRRLAELAALLGERVMGQDAALAAVARELQRGYRGLGEPDRPIASMALMGPTGVGKTATARAVCELLFDSAGALLRIDMSELMEKHAISRLLGAPPGYVGHDRDGELIAAMRARPARVVLFDEIEKAHPDVLTVLLQILDAGWIKGARGTSVSFRDAVVILTSNLSAAPARAPLGFGATAAPAAAPEADSRRALEQHLPRELVGRIGAVIEFAPLTPAALTQIAERHLVRIAERLATSGALRAAPATLREHVLGAVRGGRYGARDIERAVEDAVDTWLDQHASQAASDRAVVDHLGARPRATVAALLLQTASDTAARTLLARVQRTAAAADLLYLKLTGATVLALFSTPEHARACADACPDATPIIEVGRVERLGDTLAGPAIDQLFTTRVSVS
ncbi:MAG TPA: AAA family ATPase, partial [Kofleriaceae bacterium]|nr:AAA family ATPase [Kofleriaceae bacterium]